MSDTPPIYGTLFQLQFTDPFTATIAVLTHDAERETAKGIAFREMNSPTWTGPRQVLFVHRDGAMELWDPSFIDYVT